MKSHTLFENIGDLNPEEKVAGGGKKGDRSGIAKVTGSVTLHNILQSKKRKEAGANKKGWKPWFKGTWEVGCLNSLYPPTPMR